MMATAFSAVKRLDIALSDMFRNDCSEWRIAFAIGKTQSCSTPQGTPECWSTLARSMPLGSTIQWLCHSFCYVCVSSCVSGRIHCCVHLRHSDVMRSTFKYICKYGQRQTHTNCLLSRDAHFHIANIVRLLALLRSMLLSAPSTLTCKLH